MDTQQPSRILLLLVGNTHREFILNNACMYALINTSQHTHTHTDLHTSTEGVKLPYASATNTWERDKRLSHSQQAAAGDGSLKLHPLTRTFTVNTHMLRHFPELIHSAASSSADTPSLLFGKKKVKVLL